MNNSYSMPQINSGVQVDGNSLPMRRLSGPEPRRVIDVSESEPDRGTGEREERSEPLSKEGSLRDEEIVDRFDGLGINPESGSCPNPGSPRPEHPRVESRKSETSEEAKWQLVRKVPRNSRERKDRKEESKVLIWGVHLSYQEHEVAKLLKAKGFTFTAAMTLRWVGRDHSLRIEAQFGSKEDREELFGSLAEAARALDWRAVRGWQHEQRVEHRRRRECTKSELMVANRFLTTVLTSPSKDVEKPSKDVEKLRIWKRAKRNRRKLRLQRMERGLKLATLNAVSIGVSTRLEEIESHLLKIEVDILALSETRHSEKMALVCGGYDWLPGPCGDEGMGFTGFMVAKYLTPYVSEPKGEEWMCWIVLKGNTRVKELHVCAAYMPQEGNPERGERWSRLQLECQTRVADGHDVVVLGDLNASGQA
jgi:hypothetical protein